MVADALARIQDHVAVLLRMPAEMTQDQAIAIIEAAKLLSGETRTGNMTSTFKVITQQTQLEPELDTVYEFIAIKALKITLGNDEIPIGKQALFFRGSISKSATRNSPSNRWQTASASRTPAR